MDAGFTAEQDEIRRTLRELLHKRCGSEELRAAIDSPAGHDPALWTALSEQLGLPGLALPEAYGGVGCSATELALATEELGRLLTPSPLLATTVLTAPLILALGTDQQRAELLPRIADGSLTATLAAPATCLALTGDNGGDWAGGGRAGGVQARRALAALGTPGAAFARVGEDSGDSSGGGRAGGVQARPAVGDGWRLYGEISHVLDGHSAGILLVAAHTGGFARSRTDLFLVPGDAEGLVRVRQTALDSTRPLARLQLRDTPARLLGEEGADVNTELARLGDTVAAVLACEAVGAADRVLELTVEYVKQREQFGRPIGSFQAVKHRLADVYVQVQAARSAAYYAAWAVGRRGAAGDLAAAGRGAVGGLAASGRGAVGGLAAAGRGAVGGLAAAGRGAVGGPATAGRGAVGGLAAAGRGAVGDLAASGRGAVGDLAASDRGAAGGHAASDRGAVGGPATAGRGAVGGLAASGRGAVGGPATAHRETLVGPPTAHQEPADGPAHHEPAHGPAHHEPPDAPAHHDPHHDPAGGLALAQALEALRCAAGEAIQLHGGIGFTWEHDVHLYFKRAAGDDLLFGPVHRLRAHAAEAARLFEAGEVTV